MLSIHQCESTLIGENITLLLEILRQAVRLPIKHAEVIKKAIETAHKFFLSDLETSRKLLGESLYRYQEVSKA
jgi:hypothetical protein